MKLWRLNGEVAELIDATREFGTLLFTGLEIQWLPLYRFESDLLRNGDVARLTMPL